MTNYYSKSLSGKNLQRCYEIAPPRIKKYLLEEINFVKTQITTSSNLLELGCGYGRIFPYLHKDVAKITGIDISRENIQYGRKLQESLLNVEFIEMDVSSLKFENDMFDIVLAIQNGLSAFKVDISKLLKECIRITKNNGKILLSSYSDKIWDERLHWFDLHEKERLIGEIDYKKTKNGEIVCKDGFRATTFTKKDFENLTENLEQEIIVTEVDNSSIFCIINVKKENEFSINLHK